jgi:hypothetical protein
MASVPEYHCRMPNIKILKTGAEEVGSGYGFCPLLILAFDEVKALAKKMDADSRGTGTVG